jgi:E3 ubiquitin-protein ligase Topors
MFLSFFSNNPAQTHRLIPWLNRELVVLLPHNQTSAIPQILEDMREMLCRHDMQSRTIRKYFRRYLHQKTDHFIHEFYNFAISAYDIVGYDRHVDYSARTQSTSTTTVEISDGSSDGEVIEVIEPLVSIETTGSELNLPPPIPAPTTTVVLETSGAQEENCIITDVVSSEPPVQITIEPAIVENESVDDNNKQGEVVLESSSSDECEFVLALKPPHLRTPEMLSLDSASDSDCIFIPNPPDVVARCDSSTTDSEDNKPLAITKLKLKAEVDEEPPKVVAIDIKNILEPEVHIEDSSVNFGASTSQHGTESQPPSETLAAPRKLYFAPKRKRISLKNVFEESSSSSSSGSSSNSSSSSSEDSSNGVHKSKKKRRRIAEKNLKRQRRKSSAQNQKPLNLLPSTEEANHASDGEQPRIKSVIIVKNNSNQLYVKKNSPSSSSSSSSGS